MRRFLSGWFSILALAAPAFPRHGAGECGTTRETGPESLFQHRQMVKARRLRPLAAVPPNRDIGDIAIIQDVDGVVDRQNQFNLDGTTLAFIPVTADASRYRYAVITQALDPGPGSPLAGLDDDDSRA